MGARLLISAVILGVLALQALAVTGKLTPRYWPFLTYPMYSTARYPGDAVPFYAIFGIEEGGGEVEIRPDDVHLNIFKWESGPVARIKAGEADKLKPFVADAEKKLGRRFTALRLEQTDHRLSDGGVTRETRPVATLAVPR